MEKQPNLSDLESQIPDERRISGKLETDRSTEDTTDPATEDVRTSSESIKPGLTDSSQNGADLKPSTSMRSTLSRKFSRTSTRKEKDQLKRQPIPENDLDNGIVGWESQDDPEMPLNFPRSRKFMLLGLISAMTFLCPLTSTIFASGIQFVDIQFHNTSQILSSFAVSIFVLGFATGPLFISPLSVGGSGCLTIGAGLIADLFAVEERGIANAMFGMGALFGPVLGPVIGGFIAQRAGWRWIFWVVFIASAIMATFVEIFNKETHHQVLMKRKTIRLRRELNRPELRSCYDNSQNLSQRAIFLHSMMRPLKMLIFSPIVLLLATYMAIVYGLLYLIFTSVSQVFVTTYHFAPDLTGLVFLSLGVGFMIGMASVAKLSDATVVRMTKANGGVSTPEMRLPACIIYACFVPVTFFWFGWTADKAVYWLVPVIGLVPFAIGLMGIFLPIQTYIIDAFPDYAASGVAAITVLRSLFGAFLPLAGPSMFDKLGLGWGNSLLGFIAIAVIPFPAFIYKYGGKIREKYPIQL